MLSTLVDRTRTWNRQRIEKFRMTKAPRPMPEGFVFNGAGFQHKEDWDAGDRTLLTMMMPTYDHFINVGAHYGFYCCMARNLGVPVTALEPVNSNFAMLMANLEANGFSDNCTLIHAAAGPTASTAEINGGFATGTLREVHTGPKSQTQLTAVVPLDNVLPRELQNTLVLMDVEGFEFQALQGATHLLSHAEKTNWIIEVFPAWPDKDGTAAENETYFDIFELMFDNGYQACVFEKGAQALTPEVIQALRKEPIAGRPGGNFFFCHKDKDLTSAMPTSL
jgi:FkbM family methyltransferase